MTLSRRSLLAAPAGVALAHPALAASYPDRAVRFVVPFATGGNADQVGRLTAPGLADRLGQPVVVENRGGAGGSIGALQVARSRPEATPCSSAPTAQWPTTRPCRTTSATIRSATSHRSV